MSNVPEKLTEAQDAPAPKQFQNWKDHAFAAWAAKVTEQEDHRLAADRKNAEEVMENITSFDPPILTGQIQGRRVVADGVTFGINRESGRKTLVVLRECAQCGEEVESYEIRHWERLGQCLAGSPPRALLEPGESSPWRYHSCAALSPEPSDLVSIVKHLLLFAYDAQTGEPNIPLYAIRRAENALSAFENLSAFEKGGD